MNLIFNTPRAIICCIPTDELKGFNYKDLIGCYKGIREDSIYIEYKSARELCTIIKLAVDNKQESILEINEHREASLYFLSTAEKKHLGTFVQVPKYEAIDQDAWTYDIENDAYYICK